MTTRLASRNDTLNAYLAQAADDLSRSKQPLDDNTEGLLFLGAWHQSYPAILVRDPFLSDSAKVQFLYLMQKSSQKPQGAIAMPSLDQTAAVLGHARKTVNRDRTLLRVCRWISQCRRVRDAKGRFCGSIHAMHSEPCSLNEANRLDTTYLQLLNQTRTHPDRTIKRAAGAALAGIDKTLAEGRDPLAAADAMNRRLEAARAVTNGDGSFFDLLIDASQGESRAKTDGQETGHGPAGRSAEVKFTTGAPRVKFTPGESDPVVKFTTGPYKSEYKEKPDIYPQMTKFTTGYTCSSSNKTTTTTEDRFSSSEREDDSTRESSGRHTAGRLNPSHTESSEAALLWPDALPDNERALIGRSKDWQALDTEQQQGVLDAMARKLQDPDNPMRSPVGYAITLCKRAKSGTFQPVGAPARKTKSSTNGGSAETFGPQSEMKDLRQRMQTLGSEIRGLEEDLIPYAHTEQQDCLEARRNHLREERDALKQRYSALRDSETSSRVQA